MLSTKTEDAEDENDSIYKDRRDRRSKRTIQSTKKKVADFINKDKKLKHDNSISKDTGSR